MSARMAELEPFSIFRSAPVCVYPQKAGRKSELLELSVQIGDKDNQLCPPDVPLNWGSGAKKAQHLAGKAIFYTKPRLQNGAEPG